MLAFHGKAETKKKYLGRVEAHRKADELVRGATGQNGRGCAVWCTLDKYDHSRYPIELGIPRELAHLEDRLFEGMPKEKAMKWPGEFLRAIPVGADLSDVWPKFAIWLLKDVRKHARPDGQKAIDTVVSLYRELAPRGDKRWSEARSADAAAAAYAAADAAAYAAADAAAAAYAADADDARSVEYKVGDRVRRTKRHPGVEEAATVVAGVLGTVKAVERHGEAARVNWDGGELYWYGHDWPATSIEPAADAPAVGAPHPGQAALSAAIREEVDGLQKQLDAQNERALQGNYGLGQFVGERYANQARYQQQAQSQMVDNRPPAPRTSLEDCVALREELADVTNLLTASRSAYADAAGARDKLRADVARLEGDVAWLRHENIRLGGRAKGAR